MLCFFISKDIVVCFELILVVVFEFYDVDLDFGKFNGELMGMQNP